MDVETQTFRSGSIYFDHGGGEGVILEPGLDLVLIGGLEVGQDVVGVGFTAVDINDVCIHIPAIIEQSIGRRVSRVRRKYGIFFDPGKGVKTRVGRGFYHGFRG